MASPSEMPTRWARSWGLIGPALASASTTACSVSDHQSIIACAPLVRPRRPGCLTWCACLGCGLMTLTQHNARARCNRDATSDTRRLAHLRRRTLTWAAQPLGFSSAAAHPLSIGRRARSAGPNCEPDEARGRPQPEAYGAVRAERPCHEARAEWIAR